MQAYLVRHKSEPKELVGIFVVAAVERLMYFVDSISDLELCEYKVLGEGGLEWGAGGAAVVPYKTPDEQSDADFDHYVQRALETSDFDERWLSGIFVEDGNWKPLERGTLPPRR